MHLGITNAILLFFVFCFFFSNLNFKLKRLRCKDSLKNAFDAQALKEKKKTKKERKKCVNYIIHIFIAVASLFACCCRLAWSYSQLPWSVPGSEIAGSAKSRKRDQENKTGRNCGATTPLFPDHALIFSRAFHFRVITTIWEPGTSYSSEWRAC